MTTTTPHPPLPILTDTRTGERWQILSVSVTSDGFTIASAVLLDESGDPALDEDGYEIIKSLFLGRA